MGLNRLIIFLCVSCITTTSYCREYYYALLSLILNTSPIVFRVLSLMPELKQVLQVHLVLLATSSLRG
jgi:hypothetical protein